MYDLTHVEFFRFYALLRCSNSRTVTRCYK